MGSRRVLLPVIAGLLALVSGGGAFVGAEDEAAPPGEVVEAGADGTVLLRYEVDPEGRRHGRYRRWHAADVLAEESQWKAGLRHGGSKHYDESGTLRVAEEYRADLLQGPRRTWNEAGALMEQANYVAGERSGPFKAWHANRRLALVASYRKGLLDGKYQTWAEDGSVAIRTNYKAGVLDGKYEAFEGKTRITEQTWDHGRPVEVDGIVPFPRSEQQLRDTLAKILSGEGAVPTSEAAADNELARRQLMAYRYVMGVPHDLRLDAEYIRLAQAASEVCAALGDITHTPANPGWPVERFEPAALGASKCNLHAGHRACTSVRGYLDDSDPSNIDRVGHRAWCLNPAMAATGFGHDQGFTAMWALDSSRASVPDLPVVSLPPAGYMPAPWMDAHWAWSVALSPKHFEAPRAAVIEIAIEPVGDDFLPTGAALPLEARYVLTESVGTPYMLIFRPVAFQLAVGARYRVTIKGLTQKGKPRPLTWYTEFVDIPYERPHLPASTGR